MLKAIFNFAMFVCSCRGVTDHQIVKAIGEGAHSVEAISACTRAGTGCGSCLEEIAELLQKHAPGVAVAATEAKRHLCVVGQHHSHDPLTDDRSAA